MIDDLLRLVTDHPFVTLIVGSLGYGLLIVLGIVCLLAPRTVSRRVRDWLGDAWADMRGLFAKDPSNVVPIEAFRRAQLDSAARSGRVDDKRIHSIMKGQAS